jgi:hypothetical protein
MDDVQKLIQEYRQHHKQHNNAPDCLRCRLWEVVAEHPRDLDKFLEEVGHELAVTRDVAEDLAVIKSEAEIIRGSWGEGDWVNRGDE